MFAAQDLIIVSLFLQAGAVVRLSKLPAFKELQAYMKFNRKVKRHGFGWIIFNISFTVVNLSTFMSIVCDFFNRISLNGWSLESRNAVCLLAGTQNFRCVSRFSHNSIWSQTIIIHSLWLCDFLASRVNLSPCINQSRNNRRKASFEIRLQD